MCSEKVGPNFTSSTMRFSSVKLNHIQSEIVRYPRVVKRSRSTQVRSWFNDFPLCMPIFSIVEKRVFKRGIDVAAAPAEQ